MREQVAKYFDWDEEEAGGGTRVLEEADFREDPDGSLIDSDEAGRYAHWVDSAKSRAASLTGRPIIALCGKVWKPQRNPEDYPICPKCQELYESILENIPH